MNEALFMRLVPENCQKWGASQYLPLPPHRTDHFEKFTELDSNGLPEIPIS